MLYIILNLPHCIYSRSALSKLRGMTSDNVLEDYESLLESICKWGRVDDVLELTCDWLEAAFNSTDPHHKVPALPCCKQKPISFISFRLLK